MPITRAMRNRLAARIVGGSVLAGLTQPPVVLAAGANNGTAINGTAWGGRVHYELATGAVSGTNPTLDTVIQESANGTTGWSTIATLTQVTAANQAQRGSVAFTGPYLRSVGTVGGTSTPTVAASVLLQSEIQPPLFPGDVYVGLFTSIANHGLDTVVADMTAPAASVAVRQAVAAWGSPHDMLDDARAYDGTLLTFAPSSSTDASVIGGWYIADAVTAGTLLAWGLVSPSISLPDENRSVSILYRPVVDPNGNWDETMVIDG